MRRLLLIGLLLVLMVLIPTCGNEVEPQESTSDSSITESYYEAQKTDAYEYFHNRSIQRFAGMWVEEAIDDIGELKWNYESFTKFQILDHGMESMTKSDVDLYYCTFTGDDNRCGYFIFHYDKDGCPSYSKLWGS